MDGENIPTSHGVVKTIRIDHKEDKNMVSNRCIDRSIERKSLVLEQMISKFISYTETRLQNQDVSIKGLENQIGQLANMIASRDPGTLPSNTENNLKEQVKAIKLRNGKVLEQDGKEEGEPRDGAADTSPELKKAKLDAQFSKFLESYAKFLKDILANKRNLEDYMTINLTENCSALVQNKIPQKLKDQGSFSIPWMIGDVVFRKALCYLGASFNLMPLFVFRKLGL
ncbi:uncharacterized protein LOC142519711 [Primulina tabacum]|uniref:uncharacterized protein LOC142519711 n=1 Tax=Primulina tabacum TaxID=48773 RepID=UPI003F5A1C12